MPRTKETSSEIPFGRLGALTAFHLLSKLLSFILSLLLPKLPEKEMTGPSCRDGTVVPPSPATQEAHSNPKAQLSHSPWTQMCVDVYWTTQYIFLLKISKIIPKFLSLLYDLWVYALSLQILLIRASFFHMRRTWVNRDRTACTSAFGHLGQDL